MKFLVTIKRYHKIFNMDVEMTPQEYEKFKDIARDINNKTKEECISAYLYLTK